MTVSYRSAVDISTQFNELAVAWKSNTRHLSSIHDIVLHPAYQRIIGLGERAVPLILQKLKEQNDHWYWALGAITGDNPVPSEYAGKFDKMREYWLEYGKQRGLLEDV